MKKRVIAAGLAAVLLAAPAFAMSSGGSSSSSKPDYKKAQKLADSGKYSKAVTELKKVVKANKKNADAWNLLGFSYRKMGKFDLAWDAYDHALTLNPNHLGANEYIGELYLQQGNIEKAKVQLSKLQALCPAGCKELAELTKQVQKATGS